MDDLCGQYSCLYPENWITSDAGSRILWRICKILAAGTAQDVKRLRRQRNVLSGPCTLVVLHGRGRAFGLRLRQ